jgi:caspase domain-containing protein
MKKHFLLFILFLCCYYSRAQEKRALLIGINAYTPPLGYKPTTTFGRIEFPDLKGSRNDVLSIQSLISSKFSFKNIDTLFDASATRENILQEINNLLAAGKPGDIAFIYYAGHGSQVHNSLSNEFDKKDETIVPSDIWKEGVEDIRDKELGKMFNRFIDKGIKLTVILDCCHSGSMSRGFTAQTQTFRFIADANYDSKDPSSPPAPESRPGNNFLILSASQDAEPAEEQRDDNNVPHGAFTVALTDALNQLSVNASAENIFTSLRAILKSNGKNQEPVMAGGKERIQQTLFGIGKGKLADKSTIAISGLLKSSGKVFLQGGTALGLYKENELAKIEGNDTTVIVKIDSVLGINSSRATIIKGDIHQLKAGEFLEVINWVSSKAPLIKIYIPQNHFSYEQILQFAEIDRQLKQSPKIKWINNLEKNDPAASIFFDNGNWFINTKNKITLKDFSAVKILNFAEKDSALYFELPLNEALEGVLKEKLLLHKNILLVNNPSGAHYTVYGTINSKGVPCYGLRRIQTSAKDSLESMPVQTKYFALTENNNAAYQFIADSIYDYTMRLSKIRGWLHLAAPLNTKNNFPFHLGFINPETHTAINNQYKINDSVSMYLVADTDFVHASKKYVYVFAIDKYGNMALLYPGDGNQQNQFPKYDMDNKNQVIKNIQLGDAWKIPEPTGTDNYFLLATEDAIPNPEILFQQQGVRSITLSTPLEYLLNLGNESNRSAGSSMPKTWSLEKISIKCVY